MLVEPAEDYFEVWASYFDIKLLLDEKKLHYLYDTLLKNLLNETFLKSIFALYSLCGNLTKAMLQERTAIYMMSVHINLDDN